MVKSVFGTLGVTALFVAVGLGLLATFGAIGQRESLTAFSGNTPKGSQPGGSEGTTAQGIQQIKQTASAVGETVDAGDLSWTVTDAHPTDVIHKVSPPTKPKPGNFVVVDFTVKNISDKPVTLTPSLLALFTGDGRKFQPQPEVNGGYVDDGKYILFNEKGILQPGETKEGEANIEIPLGASASVLQLGDNDPTANQEGYVDLGV